MKIHTFLKKPSDDMLHDNSIPLDVKYTLYAITPTKKHAKIFQKTRDMSQFIYRVIDAEDSGDEYMIAHRSCLLSWYWLESYRNKNTDTQEPYYVKVLITENELNYTIECTDTGGMLNRVHNYVSIDIFKEKIKDCLCVLHYQKAMYAALSLSNDDRIADIYPNEDVAFWDTGLTFDQFAIFILLYQDTFSVDFFSHMEISNQSPESNMQKTQKK